MGLVFHLSHPKFHEQNLSLIVNILLDSYFYPIHFIHKTILRRLKFLISNTNPYPSSTPLPSPSPHFFVIPFIKGIPRKLYTRIRDNGNKVAFSVNNKLNFFIKLHKDPLIKFNHSNVVYKIDCNDCDASYVGQTGRRLATRLRKHQVNINKPPDFLPVVSNHRLLGHDFNWNNTIILDEELSYKKRLVSEMLHICQQKNSFNIQNDTVLLDDSYFPIINKYFTLSKSPASLPPSS